MIKDLRKAALGYVSWKQNQSHFRKPWRYPEDITVPRILIEDCWDISQSEAMNDNEMTTPTTPIQTPTKSKAIAKNFNLKESNGDSKNVNSNSNSSATSSPLTPQKKSTKLKKFKFKFDK